MTNAADEAAFIEKKEALKTKLQRLESNLQNEPYFNGSNYCLIDAAYAPFFQRLQYIEDVFPLKVLGDLPRVKKYAEALLARESTAKSVVPDLKEKYLNYIRAKGSYLAGKLGV